MTSAKMKFEEVLGEELSGHPYFYELILKMVKLHSDKNKDYSHANPLGNLYECERAGVDSITGVMVRLSDKYARAMNLNRKRLKNEEPAVLNEKMEDTLLDNAVYSLMGIILLYEDEENESH